MSCRCPGSKMGDGIACGFGDNCDTPLTPAILDGSCLTAGIDAVAAESSIPLAVETNGNWDREAQVTFSQPASLLAASHSVTKSKAVADIYGHLNLTLMRSVAGGRGLRPI